MKVKYALLTLLAWIAAAGTAAATTLSVSYSTWTVSGSTVMLKFLLPESEARLLTGTEVPLLTTRKLGEYVLAHVAVRSAAAECPAVDQGYDLGKVDPLSVGRDFYGFEILFRCTTASGLVLHNSVLFGSAPGHVNFARIVTRGASAEQLFTSRTRSVAVADSGALAAAGFGAFFSWGWLHLLLSPDRLCLLAGLTWLSRLLSCRDSAAENRHGRNWQAGYIVVALAAGFTLSLVIAAAGWIAPRIALLEAFVGFLVTLPAAAIILLELKQPRAAAIVSCGVLLAISAAALAAGWAPQALVLIGAALLAAGVLGICARPDARWSPWLLPAVILGFIDGFELPFRATPAQLPVRVQVWMTSGFDLGALVMATSLVGLLILAGGVGAADGGALLNRWDLTRVKRALPELSAAALGGLGTFWLFSRLYA